MNRTIAPGRDRFIEVGSVATLAAELRRDGADWELVHRTPTRGEPAGLRHLGGQRDLGRRKRARLPRCLRWTVDWKRRVRSGTDPLTVTREQIAAFADLPIKMSSPDPQTSLTGANSFVDRRNQCARRAPEHAS